MSVQKLNGFGAPYRSKTFQDQARAGTGRSGVLTMAGLVYTDLTGNVHVPAFTFMQDGLIVSRDTAYVMPMPNMPSPFYLTVNAATASPTDDLAFQYARSPLDVSEAEVILAAYDGNEWKAEPFLSIDGVYNYVDTANVDLKNVGPQWGLKTTEGSGHYYNSQGVLIDQFGARKKFESVADFPAAAEDPDFSRIDRIIYRRPDDYRNRIGVRKSVLGGSFLASGPSKAHVSSNFFGTDSIAGKVKLLVSVSNHVHVLTMLGSGSSSALWHLKLAADRTTVLVPKHLLVPADGGMFDACIDSEDNLHIAVVDGNAVKVAKVSGDGSLLLPKATASTTPVCQNPVIRTDVTGTRVYLVYQGILGAGNSQLYLRVIDRDHASILPEKKITTTTTVHEKPDFYITDDTWLYLTWADGVLKRIYYQRLDDIGDPLTSPQIISEATKVDGAVADLVNRASSPRIIVGDNKAAVITFLQDRGGTTGIAIWEDGKAFMPTVVGASDDFSSYDLCLDNIYNTPHLLLCSNAGAVHTQIKDGKAVFVHALSTAASEGGAITKDLLGSMYQVVVDKKRTTYSPYAAGVNIAYIGPGATPVSAVSMSAAEIIVPKAAFLTKAPTPGDLVTITSTTVPANNGARVVLSVVAVLVSTDPLVTLPDSYKVRLSSNLSSSEIPATGTSANFSELDPNACTGMKTTATIEAVAYDDGTAVTDMLLARIVVPSGPILDWVPKGYAGLPLDYYAPHGAHVSMDWSATLPGAVTIGAGLRVLSLLDDVNYTISSGSFPMSEDDALVVTLDKDMSTTAMPWTVPVANIPWALPVLVLGFVKENEFAPHALANMGLGTLDAGESVTIGQDLSNNIRARLGITGESTFQAYTATDVIATSDTYPEALSKLDQGVNTILTNHPQEQAFDGDGTTTQYNVTDFTFSSDPSYPEITVWVDGRKQEQSFDGTLSKNYRKLGASAVEFVVAPLTGSRITLRKEGTSTAGLYTAQTSPWAKTVDSDVSGPDLVYEFGNPTSRWTKGYFGEVLTSQLSIPSTMGSVQQVRAKTNGDSVAISAGKVVALGADGHIYHAESDVTLGQRQVGIALVAIAPGSSGAILLFGYVVPGVLAGLGFTPGDEVFISETGTYVNANATFTAGDNIIARVGWADGTAEGTDLIMNYQKIATV